MVRIKVIDGTGSIRAFSESSEEVMLCADVEYDEESRIIIESDHHNLVVQMDNGMLPGEVFLPDGRMTWVVPYGEHRLAYAPGAFEVGRHTVTARILGKEETKERRNIALNPADLRGDTDFYPHCTANVETRNESCFAARNVIDGMRFNSFHGEWPFQSWGIGAREDAWCRIDFGRDVEIDGMALTLRADFPHDAYWVFGHAVMSDGSEISFDLEKRGDRQFIETGRHIISWIRLERMVKSDDPSAFPALTEWEVFGHDIG